MRNKIDNGSAMSLLLLLSVFSVQLVFVTCYNEITIEGERYKADVTVCRMTPVLPSYRANCQKCMDVKDCAIECSLNSLGGDRGEGFSLCVGFEVTLSRSGHFGSCVLASKLSKYNCPGRAYDYYDYSSGYLDSSQNRKIYFRQHQVSKRRHGKLAPVYVLNPAAVNWVDRTIDAFNPKICGNGPTKQLYDPFLSSGRIIGGHDTRKGDFPYQVLLKVYSGKPAQLVLCGAALIDRQWIITAGHCFARLLQGRKIPFNITVEIGKHQLYHKEHKAISMMLATDENNDNLFVYPYYRVGRVKYDYALAKLPFPITKYTQFINPICLPASPVRDYTDEVVLTTGWGGSFYKKHLADAKFVNKAQGAAFPNTLQKLPRRIVPVEDCIADLEETAPNQVFDAHWMMCTSKSGRRDQCQGDSGGPFAVVDRPFGNKYGSKWTLAAVTSWGPAQCAVGVGVGARINDQVLKWIRQTVHKL